MPSKQEPKKDTDLSNLADSLKQSEVLKGLIHEQVIDAQKEINDRRATAYEKDPFGVIDSLEEKYGDVNVSEFKTKDNDGTERNYQDLIDMSFRIRDWLDSGGSLFSEKAQKVVKLSFGDAVHSKDMHMLFPKIVSNIVMEHSQPQSNILSLYESIRFSQGTQIRFPVWSPGGQSINYYLPETGEPNELTGDLSSFVAANIGKIGIKASITEDTMRFSIIDLYRLQLRWCGEALGRFKEKLAVDNVFDTAAQNVLFDNNTSAGLVGNGYTSGRNAHGALNGTLSSGDFFDAYSYGMHNGVELDTIIIHPLAWRSLANLNVLSSNDWVMPNLAGQIKGNTGGGGLTNVFAPGWNTPSAGKSSGSYPGGTPTGASMQGSISLFGRAFKVMTSPYAPIRKVATLTSGGADTGDVTQDSVNNAYVCDIALVDSRNIGVHVIDQELFSREETKFFDQIKETAFFERYGFGSSNKGAGLYMIKNVAAIAGYDFESQPIVRNVNSLDDTLNGTSVVAGV